ncbi:hypothetical protein [Ralstonia solanacearum]|uniref:hypothetical protein n=1 Tax=Ralstonia solanacearum TaxID=305 RepID=UPI0005AC5ECA|nr:hypothetical protein [Ralstonia solanacearum]MDC6180055.1 hypothetical protein [Ralstonia solanacearum]MDC6241453.1 hypothetical protein [Ralstonia solanacearum]
MREVEIGGRPKAEPRSQFGEAEDQALAGIEAQAFARMLDRAFWFPEPHVLRFESREQSAGHGKQHTVVGVVGHGGEAWFSEDLIPVRWDYVAFKEIGWSVSKLLRNKLIADGVLRQDAPGLLAGAMPDFSSMQDPEEKDHYRWAVVNRLRFAARARPIVGRW